MLRIDRELYRDPVSTGAIMRTFMLLSPGRKLGPYEIQAWLGAGGMGEVYRARDVRLERTVAIKILPADLSSSPNLKQRFEREARAISSLSHPHICALYDIGAQDGVDFLVMEYLDGQTLADRLQKGALPIEQVLKIGMEIADALDKAHRQGITHRDLKPGNIMLTKSGAKLMDFGLAKTTAAFGGAAPGVPLTPSAPTMSATTLTSAPAPLTEQGTIIGTFLYMAPEILQGKAGDARIDIFSFGCVLYEMVTGTRPFAGKSQLSAIAAILERDPEPMTNLQPLIPPPLEHVVLRCLTKDPDERWQTSSDLVRELKWVAEGAGITKLSKSAPRRREQFAWGVAAVCIVLLIWLGLALRSTRPPERQHLRLSLLPPQSTSFVPYNFSISPDGQRLAFVAAAQDGGTALWIRSLAAGTAQQLTGTEGAMYPFWSPDSRSVGFFSAGKLKSVDPSGSAVQIICDAPGGMGGTWNDRGTIVFANLNTGIGFAGLNKVSASGGEPQPATDIIASNAIALWPSFLPDGNHFLYFVSYLVGFTSEPNKGIFVGSLSSRGTQMISRDISGNTQFVSGRLFYVRDRSLMVQPFDLDHLQITGRPEPAAQQELEQDPVNSRAGFSVSNNGVVLFQSANDSVSRLSWFDRGGKELGELPASSYRDPALSRDGTLLAVSSDDERNGKDYIHIYDLARGTSTRISQGGTEVFPVLSPNAREVAYVGNDHIYVGATDGSSKPERLLESNGLIPNDWSPDGRFLVYMNLKNGGASELDFYDFQKHSYAAYGSGAEAQFSPDGNWVAFTGNLGFSSSRDSDIFVAHFPGPGGQIQISNRGGAQARWSADGKELFYVSADKKLMAVSIDTSHGRPVAGLPHALFQTRIVSARIVLFQYAVSPDGKRFLINSLPLFGSAPLTVLMNRRGDG
jgi:serine/threonine protein kinase